MQSLITFLPAVTFLLLLLLQGVAPRRDYPEAEKTRIVHNVLLFLVNSVLMRVLVPVTLLGVSVWAQNEAFGLFNVLAVPPVVAVVVAIMILDFSIYWQHVATHKIGFLWRIHRIHHADHEMDVTTAIRFHPVELLLSLAYKSLVVVLIGASPLAVVLFELSLFVGPAFNHSNVALPQWLDKALRYVIATPDTHRAHHSVYVEEQNTNYGFFLIWWDKLFSTYTETPKDGHLEMEIGLSPGATKCDRLDQMLTEPLR